MFTKKQIIIAGVVASMLVGISGVVLAEVITAPGSGMAPTVKIQENAGQQTVLQVGPRGEALLRGTVSVVGTSTLTVKSWGGDWTVNISTSTQLMPITALTQFKVGEFVGVQGTINAGAAWTIDAKLVRDWTARVVTRENTMMQKTERHNNEQEIRDVLKNENPKNWQGVVSNVNVDAKTFTLTIDGIAYTVNLVTEAKVVDQKFLSTDLTKVKVGDTVRVWGPVTDTTINAYVFRDVSLMPGYDLKKGTR